MNSYTFTANVYSYDGSLAVLDKILTALASAGLLVENANVQGKKEAA